MLETLRNAFKIKDIRKKIIFTFLMLIVIRIGSCLPIPGVDSDVFANWFASQTADGMGFFDAITGRFFLQNVYLCIEHYPVHHVIHHNAASYNRDSKVGRNAA